MSPQPTTCHQASSDHTPTCRPKVAPGGGRAEAASRQAEWELRLQQENLSYQRRAEFLAASDAKLAREKRARQNPRSKPRLTKAQKRKIEKHRSLLIAALI